MKPSDQLSHLPSALVPSWKRSMEYGVDPVKPVDDLLTGGELKDRMDRLQPFIDACSSVLQRLYLQLKHSPFVVILSDPEGYILHAHGDPPFTEKARRVWLDSGANWHEHVKGTNAIGTVLAEKQPVSVVGSQHFCRENHFLTCYAAPLYSSRGELMGVLDVSGDARSHHPHTLGMVVAAAQACQAHYLLHQTRRELTFTIEERDALTRHVIRPMISVDEEGRVTQVNESAASLLGDAPEQCIGQSLSRWFGKETSSLLSLSEKDKRCITLQPRNKNGKAARWTVEPIRDERRRLFPGLLHVSPSPPPTKKAKAVSRKKASAHIIAECPRIQRVFALARRAAQTDATILLYGETGTGKEVAAREIHKASGRSGPLITVNCGAVPESLWESELFGYEKGSFTGARREGQSGKFEAADGGTLFLDEIGELPLSSQAALLRVLEEKRITRIGSHQSIPVDVRIIAATNKDLREESQAGRFRSDLYYRLCEVEILLPPLRERSDLMTLAEHFLHQTAVQWQTAPVTIHPDVVSRMQQYPWPGNVRELRQVIRQALLQAQLRDAPCIKLEDLPMALHASDDHQRPPTDFQWHHREEEVIAQALRKVNGNMAKAARLLGIGRTTLYRKLKQYPALSRLREHAQKNTPFT
ncbi:sigma-54-dependent Fis family transcriptional regulator [Marinithermofilum abyssi]|uniref:Sigma-54-dependent Fis family transcriptional regulator n=1 Tax=Marinithermofilum abyssi TaxID=1571185 RepID=A0A8J2VEI3_9BACL|nr:sigma-54-dependent Fis family transcriptional regulator [Marinithermofilum abyssi]GGE28892.1 sigma-54-dependent Fis family transcriptional regulator [Marinithermofilum abyssi]